MDVKLTDRHLSWTRGLHDVSQHGVSWLRSSDQLAEQLAEQLERKLTERQLILFECFFSSGSKLLLN